jgi:hypothetical protein
VTSSSAGASSGFAPEGAFDGVGTADGSDGGDGACGADGLTRPSIDEQAMTQQLRIAAEIHAPTRSRLMQRGRGPV